MTETLRSLLAKAIDDLDAGKEVDLIELERRCIATAIARMGAGDGLVERLLNPALPYKHLSEAVQRNLAVPVNLWLLHEAAAHIAALTAQNREMALDVLASSGQAQEAYAAQIAAEAEAAALRAKVARLEGALQQITDGNPTVDSPEADAVNSATIARAALTDGGGGG